LKLNDLRYLVSDWGKSMTISKKLLASTALVSVSLVGAPAFASDPLTVTVSGGIVTGFYFVDADDVYSTDDTKVAISARSLEINGEGTLDNGMVAGASLVLEMGDDEGASANQGDEVTFQEAFAYLEGGFGRVEIGGTDGAAFKMHYTSPWFVPGNGVDSPNIFNSNALSSTSGTVAANSPSSYALITEDAPKISYFTPRLSGFQLGASYTPDATVRDPFSNGFGVSPTAGAGIQEVFEIAANYAGEIGNVELGVDVYYVTGDGPASAPDPEEIGVGASLGFAGFTLGGAYKETEDLWLGVASTPGAEEQVWTVGLAYKTGPWTVGAAIIDSEWTTSASANTPWRTEMIQVGGGYSLGAGVDLGLDIQFIENDYGTSVTGTAEATSAGLVLAISF